MLIFGLAALRLLLRMIWRAPEWSTPLPLWRRRLSNGVQYSLYVILIGQAATGAIATYLWWPMSGSHRVLFWVLVLLVALHLAGAVISFVTRPRETLCRITGLRPI